MKIDIDVLWKSPNSPPLYRQFKELIKGAIAAGVYRPGEKLASEREFIATGKLSYPTVSRALKELADEGWLMRKVGSGTVVADRRGGVFKRIACIYYNCDTPLFARLKRGVQSECDANGIEVDFIQTGLTVSENTAATLRIAERNRYDAVIGFPMENMECNIRLFKQHLNKMPTILFGSYYLTFDCDLIAWDPTPALTEAVDELVARGIKRFALVSGRPRYPFNALQGMTRQAVLARIGGLKLEEFFYGFGENNSDRAAQECRDWAFSCKDKPAIICDSDGIARSLIDCFSRGGRHFPGDYLIIGSGNMPLYCGTPPDLSTVDWPLEQMGRLAIRHLLTPDNGRSALHSIICQTRFIPRRSTMAE